MLLIPLFIIGCGGGQGKAKMNIPELGFSMTAPAGWKLDNPRMCSKGVSTCLIIDEPLGGENFTRYAERLAKEQSSQLVLSPSRTISGCEAIEAVIEYPNAGSKAIKVYIHRGDRLIEVSFVVPIEEFPKYEPKLRKSINSIEIE